MSLINLTFNKWGFIMSEEKKTFNYKIEEGKIVVALDLDKDGKPSAEFRLDIVELIQESIAKYFSDDK